MTSPVLAPRERRCLVCKSVASLEDVAWRLFDKEGNHLESTFDAVDYLRGIGMAGTHAQIRKRVLRHRDHIDAFLAQKRDPVPMEGDGGVVRIPAPTGPVHWLDSTQTAIDVGASALDRLKAKVAAGALEDKDLIAVAKVGLGAAHKRADLEAKGRKMSQIDELLRLAAGMRKPAGGDA